MRCWLLVASEQSQVPLLSFPVLNYTTQLRASGATQVAFLRHVQITRVRFYVIDKLWCKEGLQFMVRTTRCTHVNCTIPRRVHGLPLADSRRLDLGIQLRFSKPEKCWLQAAQVQAAQMGILSQLNCTRLPRGRGRHRARSTQHEHSTLPLFC